MSEWQVTIPFRSREESVAGIADAAREAIADPQERQVVRALALELALTTDVATVGDAIDALEAADQPTRRALLDRARERAGLPTTGKAEAVAEFEAANANVISHGRPRDSRGRTAAVCAAPGCRAMAADPEHPGVVALTRARRWTCEQHRDLGDFSDWAPEPAFRYSRSGGLVHVAEAEAEALRQRAAAESRAHQRAAREAQRREDAERLAAFEEAAARQFRRESITGGAE